LAEAMIAMGAGVGAQTVLHPKPRIRMTFAPRNLTLDGQGEQVSHVKCTNLCIGPNAKPLKSFTLQSQPKMLSYNEVFGTHSQEQT